MAAAATLLLAAASAAQAGPSVVLTPTGGGDFTTTFVSDVDGSFFDDFTFTPQAVSGEVMVSLVPLAGPVNFFTALLNGQGFGFQPENGGTSFDFEAIVTSDQPLELQVFGFAGDAQTLTAAAASYQGVLTVTAVPEPAPLALLLAGLAPFAWPGLRRAVARKR